MTFPFSALVGQDQLRTALLLNAVDPGIGGVLVRGQRGTAKSTAVRGLAPLLPPIEVVAGCRFACAPAAPDPGCPDGHHDQPASTWRPTPLVELPVGATEDRVTGSLDLERALVDGVRAFEPGLLARANRGVLHVDEVNLLDDHLVDLLLDTAAMGRNHVEREGVSVQHAARFLLVGTMNPEEGELRPQLLDRFGLTVEVTAPVEATARAEVVRRRLAHDRAPDAFAAGHRADDELLAGRVAAARGRLHRVTLPPALLDRLVAVCAALEVDGLRGDIVIARTAVALAAWHDRDVATLADVREACLLALPHRRRRGPFEQPGLDTDELDRLLGDDPDTDVGHHGPDDGAPDDGAPDDGAPDDDGPDRGVIDGPPGADPGDHVDDGRAPGAPPKGIDGPGTYGTARTCDTVDAGAGGHAGSRPDDPGDVGDDRATGTGGDGGGAEGGEDAGASGAGGMVSVQPVGSAGGAPALAVPGVGSGRAGGRSPARGRHGATIGARPGGEQPASSSQLALAATLRAAAPHQRARTARRRADGRSGPTDPTPQERAPDAGGRGRSGQDAAPHPVPRPAGVGGPHASSARSPRRGIDVRRDDVRLRERSGRERNLVVFVVDASGSMAARRRMVAVKGAIRALLTDAYQRRDEVALVTFRGEDAQLVLAPTASVDLADRHLVDVPTGGRTPLAAGLERTALLLRREQARDPHRRPLVVLLTDGRANVGPDAVAASLRAGRSFAAKGVASVVVDTEDGFVRLGMARSLADAMAARCLELDELSAGPLVEVVRRQVDREQGLAHPTNRTGRSTP